MRVPKVQASALVWPLPNSGTDRGESEIPERSAHPLSAFIRLQSLRKEGHHAIEVDDSHLLIGFDMVGPHHQPGLDMRMWGSCRCQQLQIGWWNNRFGAPLNEEERTGRVLATTSTGRTA